MTDKKKDGNGKDKETKAAATREEAAQNAKALSAAERRLSEIRCARREEKISRDSWESDRVTAQRSKKEWEKRVNVLGQVIDNDQLDLFGGPLSKAAAKQAVSQVVAEAKKDSASEGKEPKPDDLIKLGLKPDEKESAPVAGKKKPRARQKLLTHHTGKSGPAQTTA